MKKILVMSFIGLSLAFSTTACINRDSNTINNVDHDTYPAMRDVTGTFTSGNSYTLILDINILPTDVVLVYRNYNSNLSNSTPIWELLPISEKLSNNRTLDYKFQFSSKEVHITANSNVDMATFTPAESATYLTNQTFRFLFIPASKIGKAKVDYKDYNAVVAYFNLK